MALTIDELRIEVDASAKKANTNIDNLAKSLNGLKSAVGDISGLASGLQGIANGLRSIATLPKQTTSLTTYANGIKNLETAIKSLDSNRMTTFSNQMRDIAGGLSQLNGVGNGKFVSLVNSLKKIPEITETLDPTTITNFASSIEGLTAIMTPLAIQMEKIANGFNAMPNFIKRAIKSVDNAAASNGKLKISFRDMAKELKNTTKNFEKLYHDAQRVASKLREWFDESNEYIEALNLFRVSMGEASDAALDYAEAVGKAMGIDPAEWITNQGMFMRMSTGFGISAEQAEIMSKNLTQLAYDMSSFFNVDVQTAMDKLQSGMSGQIKGLKEYGYNLSVAALQETALSLGIEQNVRSMTEAQKAQLRYITLIQKSQGVMGDMAKTINTPANALRILEAQMEQFRRQLGNLVSVLVTKFIPWLQAGLELLTEFTTELANAWGFEIPELPENNLEMGADVIEGIGDEANDAEDDVESLKKQLMGFDEINILSSGKDDASTDEALYDLGFEMPEYDFLSGLDKIDLEPYKKTLRNILDLVKDIADAFMLWKIGDSINNFFKMFNGSNTTSFIGNFLSTVGNGFKYAYSKGKSFFTSLGAGLKNAYDSIPRVTKVLLGAGGIIAGFKLAKDAGEELAEALANDNEGLGGALAELVGGVGLGVIGGAMIGGPIGAVVGGLAALVGALAGCAKKSQELSDKMMDTVFFEDYGKSIDSVKDELEESFSSIDTYIKKQELLKSSIDNAKKSANEAKDELDYLFAELSTREELSNQDVEDLRKAFDDLYTAIDTMNTARFETVTNSISEAIIRGLGPAKDELNTLSSALLELQHAFKIDYTNLNTEANSILDQLASGNLDDATKQQYRERLQQISEEMAVYAYDVDASDMWRDEAYGRINIGGDTSTALSGLSNIQDSVKTRVEGIDSTRLENLANLKELEYIANTRGIDAGVDWTTAQDTTNANAQAQMGVVLKEYNDVLQSIGEELRIRLDSAIEDQIDRWENAKLFSTDWWARPVDKKNYREEAKDKVTEKYQDLIAEYMGQKDWLKELAKKYGISGYASGGFPSMGEMFIARESGPELVGRIGNKTAVANNDQIVTGIATAVYNAMMAAQEENSGGGESRIIIKIGEETIGETAVRFINGQIIQTGVSPIYA